MSQFIYFTPEEKARAQNTDLVSLLRVQGERPIRSGREYRTPGDPSVIVHGNMWFDHSKREGGYAIRFVQRLIRMWFQGQTGRWPAPSAREPHTPAALADRPHCPAAVHGPSGPIHARTAAGRVQL